MDFVDWCGYVLNHLLVEYRSLPLQRTIGVHHRRLQEKLTEEGIDHSTLAEDIYVALVQLENEGLVEPDANHHWWRVSAQGRQIADDPTPLWQDICQIQLEPEHEQLLRAVNLLSAAAKDNYAYVGQIEREALLQEMEWSDEDLIFSVAQELGEMGLVSRRPGIGKRLKLCATYRGLVWETRRGFTTNAAFIDDLVLDWETTSVDFKRELYTQTADQKAELIKDVIGLANTKASGRRWLILGFDDKTRAYYGPPDLKLRQDHLEHILNLYTSPTILVRYDVIDYHRGLLGRLEIIREINKLPYAVAKSIGDKKRIEEGSVFVRHGSQTEMPTPSELDALRQEGEQARDTHA